MKWHLTSAALGFGLALSALAADEPARPAEAQDFVFLAEARPLLVRVHPRIDGRTMQAANDDFMAYLFRQLDLNGDGVLSKDEAARAPSLDHILAGSLTQGFLGGFPGKGGSTPPPTLAELDQNDDGKTTAGELSAYYRKKGLVPFQFEGDDGPAGAFGVSVLGSRPAPSIDMVRDGIFQYLDGDGNGKLTRTELEAAERVLLKLDTDDDELVTAAEIVPNPPVDPDMFRGMFMKGGPAKGAAAGNDILQLVTTPGAAPADMVRLMQKRYGAKGAKDATLSRTDLNLDEPAFAALDADGDGKLDAEELAGFVKRTPDLELTLRLGSRSKGEQRVELVPAAKGEKRLAEKVKLTAGVAFLNLGATRVETRTAADEYQFDYLSGFIRPQLTAQFKKADRDGNSYVDEKEAGGIPLFQGVFAAMDRDGDRAVTEQELKAYLDLLSEYKERCQGACVTLALADHSRGMFDLLDADRDGRLSVREMRAAPQVLKALDAEAKGFITPEDIPHTYRITLKKGPARSGNPAALVATLYGGGNKDTVDERPSAGPTWFRKLDRNWDGDVSIREWFGTAEQFRAIDSDGDGLISAEEAERYDARHRKE